MSCDMVMSVHHIFHRYRGRTKLQQEFIELPCNKVLLPRWLHDIIDQYDPPLPSEEFMIEAVHLDRVKRRKERKERLKYRD